MKKNFGFTIKVITNNNSYKLITPIGIHFRAMMLTSKHKISRNISLIHKKSMLQKQKQLKLDNPIRNCYKII